MSGSESGIPDSDKVIKAITPGAKSAHIPLNPNSRTEKKIILNRSTGKLSQRIDIERNEPKVSQHTPASTHTHQKQSAAFGKILGFSIAGVLLLGGVFFALTRFLSNSPPPAPPATVNTPAIAPVSQPTQTTSPPINTSPLAKGLIAHWKLDGHLNETTGTEMAGVTLSPPTFVDGKDGKAIRLDGTDPIKIAEVSPAVKALDQTFTVSIWAKVKPGAKQSLWAAFLSRGAKLYSFCLLQNYPERFQMTLRPEVGEEHRIGLATKGVDHPAGFWHHLCFVREGESASIYVNGELAASKTKVKPTLNTQSDIALMIGGNPSNKLDAKDNRAFIGDIDEVRIYNRALPPDQIKRLYRR